MKTKSKRRKVIFSAPPHQDIRKLISRLSKTMDATAITQAMETSNISDEGVAEATVEELPPGCKVAATSEGTPAVPSLFTSPPPIRDDLITISSKDQNRTVEQCLPYLAGTADPDKTRFDFTSHGVARLEREDHVQFLSDALQDARFIPYDASRPWCVYWALTGLSLLGENVEMYQQRVMDTFMPAQNATGGFGGGHGQFSHCAPSYAVILSLAQVGGPDALQMVDRRALWRWLGELKQADGGFRMCVGGEEDVRGAYCSMVIISLLNIPLDLPPNAPSRAEGLTTFLDGLPEYLSRCQSFEGGISGGPQMEAHGGYAFCALACLCILGPPHVMLPRYLDLPLLISWLSARQYAPEGGFSGRANKLVDGCYSHWVGGCWPLLEAAIIKPSSSLTRIPQMPSLYHREGLIRYILSCCQASGGGLRDKPPMYPDSYHSCYTLAGLSSAQCTSIFTAADTGTPLEAAFGWSSVVQNDTINVRVDNEIYDEDDKVNAIHPIFVIPWAAVEQTHAYYSSKIGF